MNSPSITSLVCDYMNTDLVYLREGDRVAIALKPMLDLDVTAVPILDATHRPVGIVTLRDLAEQRTAPRHRGVATISAGATIQEAARMIATENVHHLVVIDASGKALGMLSSIDVVRGLMRLPARHPTATTRFVSAHAL